MSSLETEIEEIGNYYGSLNIKAENGKYFWGIENYNGIDFKEIQKSLYDEIIAHQKRYEE